MHRHASTLANSRNSAPGCRFALLLSAPALLALAACGKTGVPNADARPVPPSSAAATANFGAGDGLPEPRCPARVTVAGSGPDINGLRLGMRRDEALNAVRCSQKDAVTKLEERWLPELKAGALKLGAQAFTVQSGDTAACSFKSFSDSQACGLGSRVWKFIDESVTVAAPGLPDHETVVGIWRTQNYRPGAMPAVDAAMQALSAKYGAPQRTENNVGNGGWIRLDWLSDPGGAPISPQNPLLGQCMGIYGRGDADQRWSEGCGMSISAELRVARDNPLLVSALSVGMMDQAKTYAYSIAMQDAIAALEQQRQQSELKQARDGAAAPKL